MVIVFILPVFGLLMWWIDYVVTKKRVLELKEVEVEKLRVTDENDMRVSSHKIDLAVEVLPELSGYKKIVITTSDLSALGEDVLRLCDWVKAGGSMMSTGTFQGDKYFQILGSKAGIVNASEVYYTDVSGMRMTSDFMMNAKDRVFTYSEPTLTALSVALLSECQVHITDVNSNIPLLWDFMDTIICLFVWIIITIWGWPTMEDLEFVLWCIGAKEESRDKFKYELPSNVTAVHQVFLDDALKMHKEKRQKYELNDAEMQELKNLLCGEKVNWDIIFKLCRRPEFSLVDMLQSEKFLKILMDLCRTKYHYMSFADISYHALHAVARIIFVDNGNSRSRYLSFHGNRV